MNDPGLDAPIQDHAETVENEREEEEEEFEEQQAYLNPRSVNVQLEPDSETR